MQFPNVLDVQLHQFGSRNIGGCQDEVGHLRKSVGHYVDGIETTGSREFTHKVRLDPLPRAIGSGNWLELTKLVLVSMFCLLAHVTTLDIVLDPSC